MNKSTVIGLLIGLGSLVLGMVLKGVNLTSLVNSAAILIIVGGTIASVMIGFPMYELKRIPQLVKILFTEQKFMTPEETIAIFKDWAMTTRREGLLVLENKMNEVDEPFLKNGMRMIIDGNDPDFVREVLMEDIAATENRHETGAQIFTQAGTYAPTLGVLGAVVGLIAALSTLNDVDILGRSIAAAFIATLLGIFTGYVLWHPFANKLRRLSKREIDLKLMMVEGLLSIQSGISSAAIQYKLSVFLPQSERNKEGEASKESVAGETYAEIR
ncbi:flagellar motor stator protein MotA [Chengkuizengella axinellae]|uniref:Flagellar motor stator protein MotA n=1 Tax=Chengkuizengella axinellae TaxID=3064388 RepID=A0ABT9IZ77_9BACL|nr:flagellar motor stator protein MotA [Chengkuizengella sp. 2205SS18-9]MDP5274681.1 flagellar motor stator protein MotA [Chengkuizengella sp. 2205SS18-9]